MKEALPLKKKKKQNKNNPHFHLADELQRITGVHLTRIIGKWIGPEGTYLVLAKNGPRYVVVIHSLDGPATYEGTSAGDRIEIQRNGKTESMHLGSGHETGMKWLLDKRNCLIIRTGEGFCRE